MLLLISTACRSSGDHEISRTALLRKTVDQRTLNMLDEAWDTYNRESYNAALSKTDSALSLKPELADIHYLRGRILFALERKEESRRAFEQTLHLDPNYSGAWFQIGHIDYADMRYDQALVSYRKEESLLERAKRNPLILTDQDPTALPAVRLQIGRAYAASNRMDEAISTYLQIIETDSTFAPAFSDLGSIYEQKGEFDKAIIHTRRAHKLNPANEDYRYALGLLLLKMGSVEESVPYLETAVQNRPWYAGALYNLGRAYMQLGRSDEAQLLMARSDSMQAIQVLIEQTLLTLQQNPEQEKAWKRLSNLYFRSGRMPEAREAAQKVFELTSTEDTPVDTITP